LIYCFLLVRFLLLLLLLLILLLLLLIIIIIIIIIIIWPKDSHFMCLEICLKSRYDSTDWTATPSQDIRKGHYKCRQFLP